MMARSCTAILLSKAELPALGRSYNRILGIAGNLDREDTTNHCKMPDTRSDSTSPHTPIHPDVRIGHVHLKVADLDRALKFYTGVLGFQLTQRFGAQAAFVSAGGYHHHNGLNTWESAGGSPPPSSATGLYHVAIVYPSRAQLADALRRLRDANIPLEGAADHGVSEALYLRDPDGNGIELYWDRPKDAWPRSPNGEVAMYTRPLDLRSLLAEA